MKWEEIVEKQANDYKEYLNNQKNNLDKINDFKNAMTKDLKLKEADLPQYMKDKFADDLDKHKEEHGMYGSKFKAMRIAHQKEVDKFFYQQKVVNDLAKNKENGKDNDKER